MYARLAIVSAAFILGVPSPSERYPSKPPPPLPEAVPPAPPAPDGHFVWNPGHYHWNYTAVDTGQRGFTWMPGNFVERPYPTSVWTNGNWALQDGSWGWTPGYWQ